jgi:ribose transport system permease protein
MSEPEGLTSSAATPPSPGDDLPSPRNRPTFGQLLGAAGPLITLVLLMVATALCERWLKGSHQFLSPENLLNILLQQSYIGIIALGMTFVIISGGIDLSFGALTGLAGVVGVWMMNTVVNASGIVGEMNDAQTNQMPPPDSNFRLWLANHVMAWHLDNRPWIGISVALGTMLAVGGICGWINGVLIARGKLAPFIMTLGALAAYRSLATVIVDGGEISVQNNDAFSAFGGGGIAIPGLFIRPEMPLRVPYPVVVLIVLAVVMAVLLNRTRFGRYVIAVGSNERAARYSAIAVKRIKMLPYVITGLLCAVAAFLVASQNSAVSSTETGNLYELDVIAAVAIGGTRLNGGAGGIFGTLVGVLILGVIGNMLNFLDVSPYLQGLVKGIIIVVASLAQRVGRNDDT